MSKEIALENGVMVVEPPLERILGALAIDSAINLGATYAAWNLMPQGFYPDGRIATWATVATFLIFPWLYGFLCFEGNSFGTMIARTKIVKFEDGTAPGALRAGWSMFFRSTSWVIIPLGIVSCIFALFTGDMHNFDPSGSFSQYHQSIDPKATRELKSNQTETDEVSD